MSNRVALTVALCLLAAALLVALAVTTPWRPLPVSLTEVDPSRDFTAAEIEREDAFHAAVRPPAYLSLALSI